MLTLPTILTLGRIASIPVLVALLYAPMPWGPWAALALYIAAAVTDYFDGYLARLWNQTSPLGKLLDPIADKMLVAAVLLALFAVDRLGAWEIAPALVILLREFFISGLREYLAGMRAAGLPVSRLAKWKTGVQMTTLGVLIVGEAGPSFLPVYEVGVLGLWLSAVLTLITGWAYVREGLRQVTADTPSGQGDPVSPPVREGGRSPSVGSRG